MAAEEVSIHPSCTSTHRTRACSDTDDMIHHKSHDWKSGDHHAQNEPSTVPRGAPEQPIVPVTSVFIAPNSSPSAPRGARHPSSRLCFQQQPEHTNQRAPDAHAHPHALTAHHLRGAPTTASSPSAAKAATDVLQKPHQPAPTPAHPRPNRYHCPHRLQPLQPTPATASSAEACTSPPEPASSVQPMPPPLVRLTRHNSTKAQRRAKQTEQRSEKLADAPPLSPEFDEEPPWLTKAAAILETIEPVAAIAAPHEPPQRAAADAPCLSLEVDEEPSWLSQATALLENAEPITVSVAEPSSGSLSSLRRACLEHGIEYSISDDEYELRIRLAPTSAPVSATSPQKCMHSPPTAGMSTLLRTAAEDASWLWRCTFEEAVSALAPLDSTPDLRQHLKALPGSLLYARALCVQLCPPEPPVAAPALAESPTAVKPVAAPAPAVPPTSRDAVAAPAPACSRSGRRSRARGRRSFFVVPADPLPPEPLRSEPIYRIQSRPSPPLAAPLEPPTPTVWPGATLHLPRRTAVPVPLALCVPTLAVISTQSGARVARAPPLALGGALQMAVSSSALSPRQPPESRTSPLLPTAQCTPPLQPVSLDEEVAAALADTSTLTLDLSPLSPEELDAAVAAVLTVETTGDTVEDATSDIECHGPKATPVSASQSAPRGPMADSTSHSAPRGPVAEPVSGSQTATFVFISRVDVSYDSDTAFVPSMPPSSHVRAIDAPT